MQKLFLDIGEEYENNRLLQPDHKHIHGPESRRFDDDDRTQLINNDKSYKISWSVFGKC